LAIAPYPGVGRRTDAVSAAKRILAIKLAWSETVYRIAVNNVPLDHRMAVRKATGLPFTAYIGGEDSIDVDSIAVLVWVSRRQRGEASLSWQQFLRAWPDELSEGDIEVWPEDASGNRLDVEGNVVSDDEPEPVEVDDPES
jgi:hypothetical protein